MNSKYLDEKLGFLVEDPEFAKSLDHINSPEELLQLLRERGVNTSEEEIGEYLCSVPIGEELSEENLENVSGGCFSRPRVINFFFRHGYYVSRLVVNTYNKMRS